MNKNITVHPDDQAIMKEANAHFGSFQGGEQLHRKASAAYERLALQHDEEGNIHFAASFRAMAQRHRDRAAWHANPHALRNPKRK